MDNKTLYGLIELVLGAVTEFHRLRPQDFLLWFSLAGLFAVVMEGSVLLSGRLVHRGWLPGRGLGSLAAIALPLGFVLFLLIPTATYIKPAVVAMLGTWQQSFLADASWNQESFRQEYWAVHALKRPDGSPLENFANHPAPEQGGHLIPTTTPAAQSRIAEIDSQRVADHFQTHFAFLARLLWTQDRPLPEILRRDMEAFFRENRDGTPYDHNKAVQLAGAEMQNLLEQKIGRIVLTIRGIAVALLALIWLPLCGWALYDAWKKLEPITIKS